MTRTQKKLISIATKRARFIQRIAKAEQQHKSVKELQGRLVDATTQQIRAEVRLERKRRVA